MKWNDYESQSNEITVILFADIDFENDLGKGKRNRKRTERYVPEGNVTSLSKEIKSRNQKITILLPW